MKNNNYIKRCRQTVTMAAAALLLLTATSCRRDLWVYQDNFKQVELDIDWRSYFREWPLNPNAQPADDPDGMTVWFFPKDGRKSFTYTSSEVRHFETYLSKGDYDGLVIDYSPMEYGRQEFIGMDYASTAKVQSLPNSYQPENTPELYGDEAYGRTLPTKLANGLYQLAAEPELIASDTVQMTVNTGDYDKYIPYKERDKYQSTLVKQLYEMEPVLIPWNFRVRIYIKGIYYLYSAEATIAGLADGYKLVDCKSSDTPCLMKLDDWELHIAPNTNDYEAVGGLGYIAKTFRTWGPMNFENHNWSIHEPQRPVTNRVLEGGIPLDAFSYEQLSSRDANEIRVNIKCLLRDRTTVKYFHFDVANLTYVFRNEYAMRIDLMEDRDDIPTLPFVEAVNGMEFDGVVVPWVDKEDANVVM
jgi:hypothetical protein